MQSYYDRLTTGDQCAAYEAVANALARKSAYAYASCTETECLTVYTAVVLDNPRYCLAHPWTICNYDGRSFALEYTTVDEALFFSRLEKTESKIRKAYERMHDASTYALYKAIFDELASSLKYDYEVYEEYGRLCGRAGGQTQDAHTAELMRFVRKNGLAFSPYGALVNGKAVCNGIAKLYKIICDDFGLPCACVQARSVGRARDDLPDAIPDDASCNHLLNVVEIDGQQAFVDLTNALCTEDLPLVRYDYFCVNYEVLKNECLLRASDWAAFDCHGPNNLYFEKNGTVFSSIGALCKRAANYIAKFHDYEVRLYYTGSDKSDEALYDIVAGILQAHCPAYRRPHVACSNGFINCVIMDE